MIEDFSELIQYLDEKFVRIDERFIKIDERFVKIDEKFTKIDGKFFNIEKRLIGLEEDTKDIRARMVTKEEFNDLQTSVDAYAKKADKLGIKLEY